MLARCRYGGSLLFLSLVACARPPHVAAGSSAATTAPTVLPLSIRPIVQVGAPVLRARAEEVATDQIQTPEFRRVVAAMIETMRKAPGVGLAAPQIGIPWRLIVLEDRPDLISKLTEAERDERERVVFPVRVFVNPVLTLIGEERAMFFEGCLSVKGFAGMVERAREVEVTGLDENAQRQTWRVKGWPARILQHEVDHINGTLYVDRMSPRSFSTKEQATERFGGWPVVEIRRALGI
jgi:peptide deformylase